MNGFREAPEDFFRCGFCRKFYKKPKVFPCLHSFCTDCLHQEVSKGTNTKFIQCPVCDVINSLPSGGIDGLVDTVFATDLQSLLIRLSAQRRCCLERSENNNGARTPHRTAIAKCVECKANFCESCAKSHLKSAETKQHSFTLLPKVSFDKGDTIKKESPCKFHPQYSLTQYCQFCQVPICYDCKIRDHTSHKCLDLDTATPSYTEKIDNAVIPLASKESTVQEMLEDVCVFEKSFEKWMDKTQKDIEEHTAKLIQAIEEQKAELFEQLGEIRKQAEKNISSQKHKYQTYLSSVKNTQKFSKYLVNHGTDFEVIALTKYIEENSKRLAAESFSDIPKRVPLFTPHFADIALGQLEEKKYQSFQLVNEINTCLGIITSMAVKDDQILLTGENSDSIHWYKLNGAIAKVLKLDGHKPSHAIPLKNGHICMTESDAHQIAIINGTGEACKIVGKNFLRTPRGLAVNNKGQIVVTDTRSDSIYILSEDGTLLKTIKCTNGSELVMDFVWYITSTPDDCLVISDRCQHYAMLVNAAGKLVKKYGRPGSGNQELDTPAGVCTDYHGNILLADSNNSRIHLLTSDLKFKKYLLTKDDGIDHPRTLAFISSSCHLIVGQYDGTVKIFHCYA